MKTLIAEQEAIVKAQLLYGEMTQLAERIDIGSVAYQRLLDVASKGRDYLEGTKPKQFDSWILQYGYGEKVPAAVMEVSLRPTPCQGATSELEVGLEGATVIDINERLRKHAQGLNTIIRILETKIDEYTTIAPDFQYKATVDKLQKFKKLCKKLKPHEF